MSPFSVRMAVIYSVDATMQKVTMQTMSTSSYLVVERGVDEVLMNFVIEAVEFSVTSAVHADLPHPQTQFLCIEIQSRRET